MEYSFEKGEHSTVKAKITLNAEEWKQANKDAYAASKGKFSAPGFRKGHVPMHVIEQMYGKGVFFEDAINICLPKYYGEFLDKETAIEDVAQPSVDIDDISDNGITFSLIIPVKPEFVLGDYKGIKVEKVVYNVTEDDVNKQLDALKNRNSREISVTDRACQDGDTTVIDYLGKIDGVAFKGGTAEKQTLVLGSKTFIPGFEEQVIGMNIGEEKDINVKFPDDYPSDEVKGKDAVFTVKLHEIKVKELPEVNDEFIKEATGEESLEAWKTHTIERMKAENDKKAKEETEDKIIKAICEKTEIDIPEAMVEKQIDEIVNEMQFRMKYQGLKFEDYLKYIGQTMEDFRKSCFDRAQNRVKQQLVVERLVKEENITASQEEIDAKVKEQAESIKKDYEEYKKGMDPRQFEYIANSIVIEKLFAFLNENNIIE